MHIWLGPASSTLAHPPLVFTKQLTQTQFTSLQLYRRLFQTRAAFSDTCAGGFKNAVEKSTQELSMPVHNDTSILFLFRLRHWWVFTHKLQFMGCWSWKVTSCATPSFDK